MAAAGVVGREVADDPDAPCVRGADQPGQRLVAAEQRVDPVEGHGVIAVHRAGREDRGQVQHVGTQARQVVEVGGDAVEVPAVELGPEAARPPSHGVGPPAGLGPLRDWARVGAWRAREPVREHLVDDRVGHPVRWGVVGAEQEVAGVGDVAAAVPPGRGEPTVPSGPVGEEPVGGDRVVDSDLPAPPGLVRGTPLHPEAREARLAVLHGAHVHAVHADPGRHSDPDLDGLAQVRPVGRHVPQRPVVVGLEQHEAQGSPRECDHAGRSLAPGMPG